ncbi:MAG: MTH1187 family thiamine-binding protein [Nitrososphaerota archaeon]|nr:MTH1187 family thiamine-binding protein [Nitrososphaerota archaeon]
MSSKNVIFAELSVNPIGSGTTSMGKEIDEALKAIKKIEGLKYEVNPMGTLLESEKLETILEAARVAHEAVLRLGDMRVETILKIDDRRDKLRTMAALK